MKNTILIIVVAVFLIIGGVIGSEIYLTKTHKGSVALAPDSAAPESQTDSGAGGAAARLVVKDDFSLRAPKEWLEAGAPVGVSLMLVNNNEQTSNVAAKKINFRSYLSVSYDTLANNTKEQYLEILKSNLKQAIPGAIFTDSDSLLIDSRPTDVLEAEISQQGADFKVLMFVVSGEGKDVWVISFNTLKENGDNYKNLFYQIAESFKVKS